MSILRLRPRDPWAMQLKLQQKEEGAGESPAPQNWAHSAKGAHPYRKACRSRGIIYIYIYIYHMKLFTFTLIRSPFGVPSIPFLPVCRTFLYSIHLPTLLLYVYFLLALLSFHSFIYLLLYPLLFVLFYILCLLHLYFSLPVLGYSVFF